MLIFTVGQTLLKTVEIYEPNNRVFFFYILYINISSNIFLDDVGHGRCLRTALSYLTSFLLLTQELRKDNTSARVDFHFKMAKLI